jgi:hypothetical protein
VEWAALLVDLLTWLISKGITLINKAFVSSIKWP